MKVVYVLHTTDEYGGATKSFLSQLYGLMALGIQPLVVLPDSKGIKKELDHRHIDTLVLNYRPNTYPYLSSGKDVLLWIPRLIARRYVNWKASARLARHITNYDLVHTNVSVIDIGQRAASQQDIPHIYHFREYGNQDFSKYFPSMRSFLSTVTYSICITRGIQTYNNLLNAETSRVIYNPIVSYAENMCSCNKGSYFLFAGRLEYNKGIEDLLQAYYAALPSYPLLVAGDFLTPQYQKKIIRLIYQLNLETKIRLLGNRNDILSLMSKAKAVIVPSHSEGFGRIVAEAMLQNCLVIGHNIEGIKEQFDNGLALTGEEIGFRFNTTKELSMILQNFDNIPDNELDAIRERAFQTAKHFYSSKTSIEQIYSFYKNILNTL